MQIRRIASPAQGERPDAWRLEKRVPLALIGALALQCAGVVIWAAYLEARVEAMERAQAESSGLNEKFARLEERIDGVRGDIAQLRHQLDRTMDLSSLRRQGSLLPQPGTLQERFPPARE